MRKQVRDILAAIPQRRNRHVDDVEAIVEIFAEALVGDAREKISVRRRDDANVDDGLRAVGADALNLAVLEKSQQQRLHAQAHLADFVHEDRAGVRLLEPALSCRGARR